PRTGAAHGDVGGMVEETQAQGRSPAAPEHPELRRPHRQDAADVRPHAPRASDRLDAAHHDAAARHEPGAADSRSDPRPSRPVASWTGPRYDRATQDHRTRENENPGRVARVR